jgi:hypothetical protein
MDTLRATRYWTALQYTADATHTRVMQLLGENREQRQEQPAA